MNRKQLIVWRLMLFFLIVCSIALAALATTASAQTFTGTITNATTRKPAAGDEVILLDLTGGLRQLGHTQSDSNGRFTFKVDDSKQPRMLQVIHQGASYYKVAPSDTSSVQLEVYDVAKRVKGIVVTADVTRVQVKGNSLQAIRIFAVKNNSAPPETQMSEHNFEFYLPKGAQIDHSMARSPGSQPVRTLPLAEKEKNRYAFVFPLRPGETQFQVLYHTPYKGTVTIDPKPVYAVDHIVVMVPKTMHFAATSGAAFQAMSDPRQSDAIVQVASNTAVGQPLTFTLSGTGALTEPKAEKAGSIQSTNAPKSGRIARATQAGARVGSPTSAPDRSGKFQWYILGGFGLLAAGAIWIALRSGKRRMQHPDRPEIPPNLVASRATSQPADGSRLALNNLKEQLFQLEVRHKQDRISQPEYEKAVAALHKNLERAMASKVA